MEKNKISDIRPVLALADIPEGRMVIIAPHANTYDYGSRADLVGIRVPATATEALRASFVASLAMDNRATPIFETIPSLGDDGALRYGWDKATNVPFSATIHLTSPSNKLGSTIPSGYPALAMGGGEFTVQSTGFVDNAGLVPGAYLEALNTADDTTDAGKLGYTADASLAVAVVVAHDEDNDTLTFRTLVP